MAVSNITGQQQGGNRPNEALQSANPPRATIVVLDDDLLFRRGVARVLRSERYDVIEVDDTEQLARGLIEKLQRATPSNYVNLVLMQSSPSYQGEDDERRHRFLFGVELWFAG